MDTEHIRQVVREELSVARQAWNAELYAQLAPFRTAITRLIRDLYGENPDGSRADGGGLVEMSHRNNVLLWVITVLSLINFFAMGLFLLLTVAQRMP